MTMLLILAAAAAALLPALALLRGSLRRARASHRTLSDREVARALRPQCAEVFVWPAREDER